MPIHDWTRVDAGIFHDFHHEWISTIKRALNAGVLPPDYYALAEQIAGGLGPDVLTLESIRSEPKGEGENETADESGSHGGLALATAPPKVRFTATAETERYAGKRSRIAVRHSSEDRVVAMIEIVSPGNKGSRHALRSFVEKAVELLDAGIHLLIVDLFPPGPRDPQGIHRAIWSEIVEDDFRLPPGQPLTLVAYSSGEVKQAFIEPVATGAPLNEMPLFLEPGLYVPVPLEATYRAAFDAVPKRWQEELEPSPPGG
ncbi:MAG: DUF4058 family protein [Planctomycetota bacterium]|jgi:hypothetical protein